MELWIRSQDKTKLIKTKFIGLDYKTYKNGDIEILVENSWFGRYKSKERGLEILDEIEKLLRPQIIIQQHNHVGEIDGNLVYKSEDFKCDIQELSTVVYQMPIE